ncbi:MAG: SDR family oxidoreductase [Chloroflexi bacterium]|nr:MAG: SDR family oxidoreductase [Chloroflexota bacterium]
MNRLENKKIVVTGASSGFGEAIALACAQAGADVALVARRADKLEELATRIRGLGRTAVVCACDVGEQAQIEATVAAARAGLGHIDVLVNNAGMNVSHRRIDATSEDEWQRIINVNLTSAWLFTKNILPEMVARREGTIINIGSKAANYPSLLAGVAYSASKMGIHALTRVTNEEGNPHMVRACTINPGVAATPILELRPKPPTAEDRAKMMQADDVAAAVVFAASLPQRANVERMDLYPTDVSVG